MKTISNVILTIIFTSCVSLSACQRYPDIANLRQTASCHLSNHDALAQILSKSAECPLNVLDFRQALQDEGFRLTTTMVANRGIHNPRLGSFILFEMATGVSSDRMIQIGEGEFFFGYFTGADGQGQVLLNDNPSPKSLTIELIAWDSSKGVYNFYELMGQDEQGSWKYRGDSLDILADNQLLHRQPNPASPKFGERLRCSGCHTGGGPIMKELNAPHNDWWRTNRPTPFAPNTPDVNLAQIASELSDADSLSKAVISGQQKLINSKPFLSAISKSTLQEQLRPLFCPVEVNLESDVLPNGSPGLTKIPTGFFADQRLVNSDIELDRAFYQKALQSVRSVFPETKRLDGDHAWLTPVKAKSDVLAIQSLVEAKLIDEEFVADVLAIDFTNPVTSAGRCQLLKHVPVQVSTDWKEVFSKNLVDSKNPLALELHKNLTAPDRDKLFHKQKVETFLEHCRDMLTDEKSTVSFVQLLGQRRLEIFSSEISKNPMGQILEPGFRVIFPKFSMVSKPGELSLNEQCVVQKL
jgi:hypothetical protein